MTFVSYAQNLEDVMLWRALKHVEKGFYVDVGAWDPVQDSVTRAFYERGWRGINIEPVQAYYDRLCCDRPLDTNIRAAIGQSDGELTLYEIPESGLSTTNMETADMHRMAGLNVVERKVESKSLNTVLEEHISGPIHFLKVDVEGSEFDVLRGLDLSKWRPWILVVEATIPNSPETNFASWEPMVLSAGYVLAYFDGLNYFYVAHEHEALAESLKVPPNVFDKYASACLIQTKQLLEKYADDNNRIERILTEARANNDRIERLLAGERVENERIISSLASALEEKTTISKERDAVLARYEEMQASFNRVTTELDHIYQSRSFKLTAPLRGSYGAARGVVGMMRKVPGVSLLLNSLRRSFPDLWDKADAWLKNAAPLSPEPEPIDTALDVDSHLTDDERRYLELFQHEFSQLRKGTAR